MLKNLDHTIRVNIDIELSVLGNLSLDDIIKDFADNVAVVGVESKLLWSKGDLDRGPMGSTVHDGNNSRGLITDHRLHIFHKDINLSLL